MKKGKSVCRVHRRPISRRSLQAGAVYAELKELRGKLDEIIKFMNLEMEVLNLLKDILTKAEVGEQEEATDFSDDDDDDRIT